MNSSDHFNVDVEIGKALSRLGLASDEVSTEAMERIRNDVEGMIGAYLDFSDKDQISEVDGVVGNWIKKFPK